MRARLLDLQATLYTLPDSTAAPSAQLVRGQELEITGATMCDGQQWAIVTLPDGVQSYLPADTTIQRLREMHIDAAVEAHTEPSIASPVLEHYPSGTMLILMGTTIRGNETWISVRGPSGRQGFIPRDTSMADVSQLAATIVATDRANRNMIVGGVWCIGGIAVTVITYANAYGGGKYVVAWGAIIFGGYECLKGLLEGD